MSYNVKRRRSEGCDVRIFVRDAKTDLNNHDIGNAKKKKNPHGVGAFRFARRLIILRAPSERVTAAALMKCLSLKE